MLKKEIKSKKKVLITLVEVDNSKTAINRPIIPSKYRKYVLRLARENLGHLDVSEVWGMVARRYIVTWCAC